MKMVKRLTKHIYKTVKYFKTAATYEETTLKSISDNFHSMICQLFILEDKYKASTSLYLKQRHLTPISLPHNTNLSCHFN